MRHCLVYLSYTCFIAGRFFTSVAAYNGAMEPSDVACSDGITFDKSPPTLVNVSIAKGRTSRAIGCTLPYHAWLVHANMTRVRLTQTQTCSNMCTSIASGVDIEHFPISSIHTLEEEVSDDLCRRLTLITSDSQIILPSDYLHLQWAARDDESDMEEFFVGLGQDRTMESAPDVLPFVQTHGHSVYHGHLGLNHGTVFFIFLQALSKAGLFTNLTLGPVVIDVTPPEVSTTLTADVQEGFLVVTWSNGTFIDPEQSYDAGFEVHFRVGQ